MDILNQLAEHLSTDISCKERYGRILAELNAFCEQELTTEQADKLNDIIGDLISTVSAVSSKESMKLGAKIVAELLSES